MTHTHHRGRLPCIVGGHPAFTLRLLPRYDPHTRAWIPRDDHVTRALKTILGCDHEPGSPTILIAEKRPAFVDLSDGRGPLARVYPHHLLLPRTKDGECAHLGVEIHVAPGATPDSRAVAAILVFAWRVRKDGSILPVNL